MFELNNVITNFSYYLKHDFTLTHANGYQAFKSIKNMNRFSFE